MRPRGNRTAMMPAAELHAAPEEPLPLRLGSTGSPPVGANRFQSSVCCSVRKPPAGLIPRFLGIPAWFAEPALTKCYNTISCDPSSLGHDIRQRLNHSWLDPVALARHKKAKQNFSDSINGAARGKGGTG